MKRDWIKLDVGMLNDPTYGKLPDDLWRLVIQLSMLAGEHDNEGLLPSVEDMAWVLHAGVEVLLDMLWRLYERGLVHSTPLGWVVTGFKESQAAANSTERSRAFRKRRKSATQEENESNDDAAQDSARCATQDSARCATRNKTYCASEMQPSRHLPVSKPVANPISDPGQPRRPGKRQHSHKAKGQPVDTCPQDKYPVEKPVENFVEKGRKNSDSSPPPSSTSSLTKYLNTSLNIKLPLLEPPDLPDPETESEKFRPSQGKTLENKRDMPGSMPFSEARQVPSGRSGSEAERARVEPGATRDPVDKSVDNPVEKGRKNSDPDDMPP